MTHNQTHSIIRSITLAMTLMLTASLSLADEVIRVATYNIKFFDTDDASNSVRMENLEETIDRLDADVIGLQEIDDIDALDLLFPESHWIRIIDDQSGNSQDLAMVVRRNSLGVVGVSPSIATIDAGPEHFLCEDESNTFFPVKRDVLTIGLEVLETGDTFTLMVVHTKSRFERAAGKGRATNDPRREGASKILIQKLDALFDGQPVAILGDFNDNPDDRSLNILETGDPDAPGGAENNEGPFMINLTEALMLDDHVSHGLNSLNIDGDTLNTTDPGSRERNNIFRGTNEHTGDILFDQILVSPTLRSHYIVDSCMVFNHPSATRGNSSTRASDHVPVIAEFVFFTDDDFDDEEIGLTIASLLPNPDGEDAGNEQITISNSSSTSLSLTGFVLRDRAGHTLDISGSLSGGASKTITLSSGQIPLNNSGDEIELIDPDGNIIEIVSYTRSEVNVGVTIEF